MTRTLAATLTILLLGGLPWLGGCSEPPPPPRPASGHVTDPLVAGAIEDAIAAVEAEPRRAHLRAELARVYQANDLPHLAEAAYEQALRRDRAHPRWWYGLALVRAVRGDYDGALAALDDAESFEAGYAPIHWRRGAWLMELGRFDEARPALERAPEDPAARTALARLDLLEDRPQQAAQRLAGVLEQFPDLGYLHQLMAEAYRRMGRFPEARRRMAQADGRRPHWSDPWQAEIEARRAGYAAELQRADALMSRGRGEEALGNLEALRGTWPGDATLLAKIGEVHLERGDPAAARAVLEEALGHEPDSLFAHLHLARALRELGDAGQALIHAEAAIAINPDFGPAWREKANVLLTRQQWAPAEEALEEVLRCNRPTADLLADLASIQFQQRDFAAAETSVRSALQVDPEHLRSLLVLAHVLGVRGDLEAARAVLEGAARLRPGDPAVEETERFLRSLEQSDAR